MSVCVQQAANYQDQLLPLDHEFVPHEPPLLQALVSVVVVVPVHVLVPSHELVPVELLVDKDVELVSV